MNKSSVSLYSDKYAIFYLLPTTRKVPRPLLKKIATDCDCLISVSWTFNVNAIVRIIREIQTTQSWRSEKRVSAASIFAMALKIMVKRPSLALNLLFRLYKFTVGITSKCKMHNLRLEEKKFWYSVSTSRVGFPWSLDPFINSLDSIRNLENDFLLFGSHEKKPSDSLSAIPTQEINERILNGSYQPLSYDPILDNFRIEASWSATKVGTLPDASILNGMVVSNKGSYFSTDSTKTPWDIPPRMTPCAIWAPQNKGENISDLICPANFVNTLYFDEGFFVSGNTNFYHFISESLRPLVLALETGIIPKIVLIADDLPQQFYGVLELLCPDAELVKLGKGTNARINRLSTGLITDRLSRTNEVFSNYEIDSLLTTDEWRTWLYIRRLVQFSGNCDEKLYIPRLAHESRGLLNSRKISRVVKQSRFSIFNPTQLSFQTQVELISKSRVLCSTSGASLLNMIFMPRHSNVLEITYPVGHSWKFLADLLELKHFTVQVSSPIPSRLEYAIDSYFLSPRKLRESLSKFK
jgi:hypothetical protein